MKAKIAITNEVYCVITGLSKAHNDFLLDKFSPFVDGYRFMPMFQLGRWSGKISFFEKTGKTYVRLLSRIIPYLDNWGYEIELVDPRPYYEHPKPIDENIFADQGIIIRPYQVEAINACIEIGTGVALLGTGAGKSLITAALSKVYSDLGHNAITVVPSSDLVQQTYDWYDKLGLDVGIYCGNRKEYDHPNVVATWQSIQHYPKLLKSFNCIIWDETHSATAQVASKLLNTDGVHVPFKFGVTGTFPKPEANKLSLHSSIGDILIEVPASWLIEQGYLASIDIEQIELKETHKEEFPDYASEKEYLSRAEHRMDVIADLIIAKAEEYGNCLVLVSSVPFGKKLAGMIQDVVFLSGENKRSERKEQYDMFEDRDGVICIATTGIASTGISIDRVKTLVFVDVGKSFITTIQSVGRGTRLAADKKSVHVVDIYSSLKYAKKHANERKKWYKEAEYEISKKTVIKI